MPDNNPALDTNEELVTDSLIAQLKKNDTRWQFLEGAIQMETELQSSKTVEIILSALKERAENATQSLLAMDPTDYRKIAALQETVRCVRFIANELEAVRQKGVFVQRELENEGQKALDIGEKYDGSAER
jgi:hypothetical protein